LLQLKANKNALDMSSEDIGVGLVEGKVDLPQFMSVSVSHTTFVAASCPHFSNIFIYV